MLLHRLLNSASPIKIQAAVPSGAPIILFLFALALRLIHLLQIRSAPIYDIVWGDSLAYDEWARRIAGGDWLGKDVFYQAPLYPYFLAIIYKLLGTERAVVMFTQSLLGAASCVLLANAGSRLQDGRGGLISGYLLALYAPAIFFDGLIQKSSLDLFLLSLSCWLLIRWQLQPHMRSAACIGFAVGLLILSRENAIVFVPAIATGMLLYQRLSLRRRFSVAAAFVAGTVFVLTPVAIRNQVVGGELHLTTSQFGPNFFIGNNPHANGMYQPIRFGGGNAAHERNDATELAELSAGRPLTPAQVSRYWTQQAVQFIREKPVEWGRLMLRKLMLLMNSIEIADTEDQQSYSDWSIVLRAVSWFGHFGVVAPLAVLGFVVSSQNRKQLKFILLMTLAYAFSVWLFYIMGRYRYPLVPMIMLPAGMGLSRTAELLRDRSFRPLLTGGSAAAVAAVICNWPVLDAAAMKSITQYNMAVEFDRKGRTELAEKYYRRTLELNPADADAHQNLADVLTRKGSLREAAAEYEFTLRLDAERPLVHFELANIHARTGNADAAITHYQQTIRLAPDFPVACLNLGVVLNSEGRIDEAIAAMQAAVELDPGYSQAIFNLAGVLASAGRDEEAATHYGQLLKLEPDNRIIQSLLNRVQQNVENSEASKNK